MADLLVAAERRISALRRRTAELERAAAVAPAGPEWAWAFHQGQAVAVIAEIKRRSPSAGEIAAGLDPADHARAYVRGGARAISVLTDPDHFGGSMADLVAVREAVEVPVLRKDFMLDPLQLIEARAAGAAAVLLIVRALRQDRLESLLRDATGLGLGTLVEVHDTEELDRALAAGAAVIGVNARDLDTFAVDLAAVEAVLRRMPPHVVAVAESGLTAVEDVRRVAAWGADGILVGTSVARARDPESAVRALSAVPRAGRPKGAT